MEENIFPFCCLVQKKGKNIIYLQIYHFIYLFYFFIINLWTIEYFTLDYFDKKFSLYFSFQYWKDEILWAPPQFLSTLLSLPINFLSYQTTKILNFHHKIHLIFSIPLVFFHTKHTLSVVLQNTFQYLSI